MDEEEFDGETYPLPDDLKFADLVSRSLELSEKMGEHLHGQEQTLAVCSLILLLKSGLKMAQAESAKAITEHPAAMQVLTQAAVAEEAITKFLAIYPSLRIGDDYERQVDEYFAEKVEVPTDKGVVEVPTEEELTSLCEDLFTLKESDE
jgi:hypothetical protein